MDLSHLSDEELQKIASEQHSDTSTMSDEDLQKIAVQSPGPIEPSQEESNKPGMGSDIIHMLGQSAAGLGLAGDAAGMGASLGYLTGGGSFSELSEIYNEARNNEHEAAKRAEKDHPSLSTGINLASGLAVAPINPVAVGATMGFGLAPDGSRIMGAATGAALGKAGQMVGEWAGDKVSNVLQKMKASQTLESLGAFTESVKARVLSGAQRIGLSPKEFTSSLENLATSDGTPLVVAGQSMSDALEKSGEIKTNIVNGINELVHSVDLEAGGGAPILAKELSFKVSPILEKYAQSSSEMKQAAATTIQNRLNFMEQNKPVMTLRDLHQFVRDTASDINWGNMDASAKNMALSDMQHVARNFLSENIEKFSNNPMVKNTFESLNKKYSALSLFDEVTSKVASKELAQEANVAGFGAFIKNAANLKFGDAAAQISNFVGVTPAVKNATLKIMDAATNNPQKYGVYLSRLIEGGARSPEAFNNALTAGESIIDLAQSPVARASDDVQRKAPQIYNLLADENPVLARKFNEAVAAGDNDNVGALMSSLSQLPKYKGIIQPGIGWDGKVTNPTEKNVVRQQIMDSNLTTTQKMRQAEALENSGVIPVPEPSFQMRNIIKEMPRIQGRKVSDY